MTSGIRKCFAVFVLSVCLCPTPPSAQQPAAPATQAQQRPIFRGGTRFVRVDAYPVQDGRIVEGLRPEDFEVLEDGKPQAIESFDFVTFETFTPEAARHDPPSQQAGFDMAADPRYRVFVVVVDLAFTGDPTRRSANTDLHYIEQPLSQFLHRVLGPKDLFGFLTSRNSVKDLVLGQRLTAVDAQIADLFRSANIDRDDAESLTGCSCGSAKPEECDPMIRALQARWRLDDTYSALDGLVAQLGAIRQERKNIIFVSNSLPRWGPDPSLIQPRGPTLPKAGITAGRVGIGDRIGENNESVCAAEFQKLANLDFDTRYRNLLREAMHQNVSFYVIAPQGLTSARPDDSLIALANDTDGLAIVNTNDLNPGMRRIADDLYAYYVLGYYTTNTKFDGGIRKITVKLKGKKIRARREYRAPTEAEMAALTSAGSAASSLAVASAPSRDAPAKLVGEPAAYRIVLRQPPQKASPLEFVRSDRLRVEWPVLAALDRREARLLDSAGKPLPVDLPVSENESTKTIVVELPLAPLTRGVYSIELTAGSGTAVERRRLTFMMK